MADKVSLYASVGAELTQYDMDVEAASLSRRGTVSLPANVQYVWPHASRRHLYVATSDSASGMGKAGNTHHVTAFGIDPATGALSPHGAPIRLPTRPIHMATDIPSQYILVAFSNPSGICVYRINADATPGEEVAQPGTDRSWDLRAPGARDAGQSPGDPGHARPRRGGWQTGGTWSA